MVRDIHSHDLTCVIDLHLAVILVKVGRVIECNSLTDSSYSRGTKPQKKVTRLEYIHILSKPSTTASSKLYLAPILNVVAAS